MTEQKDPFEYDVIGHRLHSGMSLAQAITYIDRLLEDDEPPADFELEIIRAFLVEAGTFFDRVTKEEFWVQLNDATND